MDVKNITKLIQRPICFFDLETTGVDPLKSRIVQICVKKINPDGTIEAKTRLINPGEPIPVETSEIHGITDEMVSNEPTFKRIAAGLAGFMSGCDFGGYNTDRFDIPLLAMEFERAGVTNPFTGCKMIDVFRLFCHFHQRNLATCFTKYTGKTMDNAHDAENDVNATIEVFEKMLDVHSETLGPLDALGIAKTGLKYPRIDLFGKVVLNKKGKRALTFGKHKNESIVDLPESYISWLLSTDLPGNSKQAIKMSRTAGL